MRRVLAVDDDPPTLRVLTIGLRAHGFAVATAKDAESALALAAQRPPEAMLLDLGLPDRDGLEVLRALREWSGVPVLVVSGRSGVDARVGALDAGADDFLVKPFSLSELAARLRAVLRRPAAPRQRRRVQFGPYCVDLDDRTISADDGAPADVHLTPTEWRLLTVLLRAPDRLVTGREMLTEIWGPGHVARTNYLRIHMLGLRRKLERDPSSPRHLLTEPGLGYRFRP